MKVQDLTDALLEYMPDADVDIILNAYIYSAKAHRGQSRRSGEAYISHPLEVANNLVKLKLDATTVAAGLLHDTIEDTLSTPEEIKELFGDLYMGGGGHAGAVSFRVHRLEEKELLARLENVFDFFNTAIESNGN